MFPEQLPREPESFLGDILQEPAAHSRQIQEQLQRLKHSEAFVRSARIKRLLDFLIENELRGHDDRLKESVIGIEVFDRPADYDPKTDPIVRVEMRRLRSKLSEYYLSEGVGDPILIWLEKGTYVPTFKLRSGAAASHRSASAIPESPPILANKVIEANVFEPKSVPARPIPVAAKPGRKNRWLRFAVVLMSGLLAAMAAWWLHLNRTHNPARSLALIPLTGNAGLERTPAFSPNSQEVAYSWDGNRQNFDIYVKQLNGAIRRLTDNAGHDIDPAWSPDGKRVAFLRILPDESQVVTVPAFGGIETIISRNRPPLSQWHPDQPETGYGHGPVWSSDTSYLLVAGCSPKFATCGLIKAFLDGRQELLTNPPGDAFDSEPAISPSGRYVAFVRTSASKSTDIFVMSIESKKAMRLTSAYRDIAGLNWLDAENILYSSNRGGNFRLWRINKDGGDSQFFSIGGAQPQWPSISADGHWVAFEEPVDDTSIWRISLEGKKPGSPEQFISSSGSDDSPAFSAHGDRIVFVSNRTGTSQLWLADQDGTNVKQLTEFEGSTVGTPHWSPDDRRIVFDASLNGQSSIWLIDSNGTDLHRLNNDRYTEFMPSWSHDGQWVYYDSFRDGRDRLYKQRPDTGETVQVADDRYHDAVEYPAGNFVLAERRRRGIWQIPLNSNGHPAPVTALAGVRTTRCWTLAGNKLYFVQQEESPREVDELDLATRQIRKVANLPAGFFTGTPALTVDPGLHSLLFVQKTQDRSAITLQER